MAELTIVGVGMRGARHLTLESVQAIAAADVVYHLVTGGEAVAEITRLNPRTYGLFHLYQEGTLDLDVYGQMVGFLLAQAAAWPRVAFVVMGHPSIYVAATHMLARHGPPRGIAVNILAGISAIDVMLLSMPADIGSTGLQILDANRLISYQLHPDIRTPLMIFQVGCFGSGYITRSQVNDPGRLSRLADYLLTFYPPHHVTELIECEMGYPHRERRYAIPLADLGRAGHLVTYNSTLLVPPALPLQVRDPEFHAQLGDPAALPALVAS